MSILDYVFNRKEQINEVNDTKKKSDNSEVVETSELSDKEEEVYEVLEREILPTKIICPDCGGITLEGLEFCDKCGGELL